MEIVVEKAGPRRALLETCTPSYYNYEGNPERERFAILSDLSGEGPLPYFERLRKARADPDLGGLVVTPGKAAS